ncbi:MBOAT family O-acyltransferase [Dysosmobacter sp.]|uniref:MBOAT family O-acyltransferase n=1 Tax=Dysosmobacter sp. TaxID=2591382 RepID=UPI002A8BB740|nr:MBOAT family O-acyltransferase [Dysosmobacter sp.]MDY3281729.1 MBOAT family O-acyltransferase [Dysosmobacter sp.]
MAFQSLSFPVFLAVTAAVCLAAGRGSRRRAMALLFAAGCVFYLWPMTRHAGEGLCILLAGMAVTWLAARQIRTGRRGKGVFLAALVWHLGVLLSFKYVNFFSGGAFGPAWAPLGLSFFTFQQIWYLKEVYTGQWTGADTGTEFCLYSLFFPAVSSGPILRPGAFLPQLRGEKFLRPDGQDLAAGLYAICMGTIKKVLLADSFGVVVNNGWSRLADLSAPAAWLVILGYSLQLYFDFSGYCDIAAGAARLLGLRLPVNFDSPYRSTSVGGFWKRWHMTLTAFLRECVYFPLGGSRGGAWRTCRNIFIVYLVSGWWHGAGWTFLLWGALHGVAQVMERLAGDRLDRVPRAVRWCVTFAFVNLAWVFFRAPDVGSGVELLTAAVSGGLVKPEPWLLEGLFSKETGAIRLLLPALKPWMNVGRLALLYGAGLLAAFWPRNVIRAMEDFRPTLWRGAVLTALTVWSVLSFTGITTFIYSNF